MTQETRQNIFAAHRYEDAWGALDYLERCFGFERTSVFEGPGKTVAHAEMRLGSACFGLNSAYPPSPGNPWTTVPTGVYVALPDATSVDEHHARAERSGAAIALPLETTSYGSRQYSAWDCERRLWCFGTYTYAPAGEPALFVGLRTDNLDDTTRWLERAFAFAPVDRAGDSETARLRLGDSTLLLTNGRSTQPWGADNQATFLEVADPDAHSEKARRDGATIVQPPANGANGRRAYYARDPGGFLWGFGRGWSG
jgi:uncharacterized glyoxalase superfamily protein PhnB